MLVSIILLQVSSIWTTIFLCSSGVFTHLICVLAVLHWTEMLVVHIEQAVRQWYETSYYYLRTGGRPGLDLSGVTASHKFILTTKLAAVRHLFDQRSMIIDSGQYKLSSDSSYTDFYLPARSHRRTAYLSGIYQNCMKNELSVWRLYYCHQRAGKDVPSCKSVKWNTTSLSRPYLITPREQNYQKCCHCSC